MESIITESVAGEIDRHWIDRAIPELNEVPLRIQHRTGRLSILNSAGLDAITATQDESPLEVSAGEFTGRLYDADIWLRSRLAVAEIDVGLASKALAARGIAGVTDATPGNGPAEWKSFHAAQRRGELLQDVVLMGGLGLGRERAVPGLSIGPVKFHLHEADLPPLQEVIVQVSMARRQARNVAFHCVTVGELAFAVAALHDAGASPGDRIEHASVTPVSFLSELAELGLTIVTQPHFIFERGDTYQQEVEESELDWLYRGRSFLGARIPLAAGSDAPFGSENPWGSMASATKRMSRGGVLMGHGESLTPEEALQMYTGEAAAPGGPARQISEGKPATLCVLDRAWAEAREALDDVNVRLTMRRGTEIWRA